MPEALLGAVSAAITAGLLFLGARFTARQSRAVGEKQIEVDQRKVDQESFDRFIQRYETDRERQNDVLTETRSLLRSALKHINLLRSEMRTNRIAPPALPPELETVPWDLYEGGPQG